MSGATCGDQYIPGDPVTDESGYWGRQSTRREIAYAHRRGMPVEIRHVLSGGSQ